MENQTKSEVSDNSNNSSSNKKKDFKKSTASSKNSKLAQTFFALTLFIFATYFALNFFSISNSKIRKSGNKLLEIKFDQNNDQVAPKISEIQEKILDKFNKQPELINTFSSVGNITIRTKLHNEIIIKKIESELEELITHKKNGEYNLEVEIFEDTQGSISTITKGDSHEHSTDSNGGYDGTDANILLQISIFEEKSKNKIGELGVAIPLKILVVAED